MTVAHTAYSVCSSRQRYEEILAVTCEVDAQVPPNPCR